MYSWKFLVVHILSFAVQQKYMNKHNLPTAHSTEISICNTIQSRKYVQSVFVSVSLHTCMSKDGQENGRIQSHFFHWYQSHMMVLGWISAHGVFSSPHGFWVIQNSTQSFETDHCCLVFPSKMILLCVHSNYIYMHYKITYIFYDNFQQKINIKTAFN